MVDKIRPLKIESIVTGGGVNDKRRTATDPTRNYLATKGVAFENSDNQLIDINISGDMQFKDTVTGTKKLSELASPVALIIALG